MEVMTLREHDLVKDMNRLMFTMGSRPRTCVCCYQSRMGLRKNGPITMTDVGVSFNQSSMVDGWNHPLRSNARVVPKVVTFSGCRESH